MNNPSPGIALMSAGIVIVIIGFLIWSGMLSWFGRLPGDIRIERENTRFYFPVVSMLLVSLVLTLVMNLFRKLF